MTEQDLVYLRRLIYAKIIADPVLELGAGYGGATSREYVQSANLRYYGTDLKPGEGVDFVADFERRDQVEELRTVGPFGTVLILNVLEHTFDPIRVLDNCLSLLRPGGIIVAITPSVWPLHNFPMDAWRLQPNFYEEYASRRGLELIMNWFEYVGFGPVANFLNTDGSYRYPPPSPVGFRQKIDRGIHKICNTFGRKMFHPSHVAVAAVFRHR